MTPQELRGSILSLAIQGKLTERLPEDGDARALLFNSVVEDNVDGQRVKEKTITEINDNEKTFDIPDTWEWIKLGNVCVIARGGSPRPIKEYITTAEDGINWIKIGDTEKNGKYISATAEKIKPCGVSKSRMVHAGDFLLTNSMSFGRPYILKVDGCIHDGWLVISQSKEIFDQDFLYWLLSSNYAYMQFCGKVSGAVVKNLNSEKVANSVFPLPPLAEQKRIVARIEELLLLIDRYEQAWNKLEEFNKRFPVDMQKSILQMAIKGNIVPQRPDEGTGEELYRKIQAERQTLIKAGKIKKEKPLPEISDDEKPFDIPESWRWVRVGDCGSWSAGATPSRTNIEYYGGNIPWLKTGDLNDGFISKIPEYITEKALNKTSVRLNPVGSVLMAMYGATIGKLGILEIESTTNQACCACITYNGIYNKYLFYFLLAWRSEFIKMGEGGAQPNISREKIVNTLIPLPPLAEQKRIVAKLEELLPLCERLK